MKRLLILSALIAPVLAYSQQQDGGIRVHQDPRIPQLSLRFKSEHTNVKLRGYKVQIYFGDRTKATDIKNQFMTLHPDVAAEIDYLAPNFRVRVGNFRSHMEAERFLRQIKPEYSGAYVVPDNISLPGL